MFGVVLKKLRKVHGLTQIKFAEEMKLNPVTVNRYENEKRFPDISTLIDIADYFDVPLDLLVGREWPAKNKKAGVYENMGASEISGASDKISTEASGASAQKAEESAETDAISQFMMDEAYMTHMLDIYQKMHKQYGIALPLSKLSESGRVKVIEYYDLICNSENK